MQVGSLVECIHTFHAHVTLNMENKHLIQVPVKGRIYTIRNVYRVGNLICVHLEEIINIVVGYRTGKEIGFNIDKFRLLQPPMKIEINAFSVERIIII